jgi:hypothetical protein
MCYALHYVGVYQHWGKWTTTIVESHLHPQKLHFKSTEHECASSKLVVSNTVQCSAVCSVVNLFRRWSATTTSKPLTTSWACSPVPHLGHTPFPSKVLQWSTWHAQGTRTTCVRAHFPDPGPLTQPSHIVSHTNCKSQPTTHSARMWQCTKWRYKATRGAVLKRFWEMCGTGTEFSRHAKSKTWQCQKCVPLWCTAGFSSEGKGRKRGCLRIDAGLNQGQGSERQ